MHKSRLAGFIIDCRTNDLESAGRFWSQALGYTARAQPGDDKYLGLSDGPDTLQIEIQRVDHPSRVHLDIETDDIEAEVKRLEALGARRVEHIKRWWVMEAPTGQRFCVVRPQRPDFAQNATIWKK